MALRSTISTLLFYRYKETRLSGSVTTLSVKSPPIIWTTASRSTTNTRCRVSQPPSNWTSNAHALIVSLEEQANFTPIIDSILAASDLTTISEKRIRKGLQAAVEYDLTEKKVHIQFPDWSYLLIPLGCPQRSDYGPFRQGHSRTRSATSNQRPCTYQRSLL